MLFKLSNARLELQAHCLAFLLSEPQLRLSIIQRSHQVGALRSLLAEIIGERGLCCFAFGESIAQLLVLELLKFEPVLQDSHFVLY